MEHRWNHFSYDDDWGCYNCGAGAASTLYLFHFFSVRIKSSISVVISLPSGHNLHNKAPH